MFIATLVMALIIMRFIIGALVRRKQKWEAIESLARLPGENPNPVLRTSNDGVISYANEAGGPLLELLGSEVARHLCCCVFDKPCPNYLWVQMDSPAGRPQPADWSAADSSDRGSFAFSFPKTFIRVGAFN